MPHVMNWKRRLLLLFTSGKRLGAGQHIKKYQDKDFLVMKQNIITEDSADTRYENKKIKDLDNHLAHLKHEFAGQSELCYYHATLIVLLRRQYKPTETYAKFLHLWENETIYLLKHLSLRWIISACDTFVDHDETAARKAILMNAVSLINTLRIHETQLFLISDSDSDKNTVQEENLAKQHDRIWPLYDGLTYFRAGGDDTLNNMRVRYESFGQYDELATQILLTVFERVHNHDTAFNMMKKLNQGRPDWWTANVS